MDFAGVRQIEALLEYFPSSTRFAMISLTHVRRQLVEPKGRAPHALVRPRDHGTVHEEGVQVRDGSRWGNESTCVPPGNSTSARSWES